MEGVGFLASINGLSVLGHGCLSYTDGELKSRLDFRSPPLLPEERIWFCVPGRIRERMVCLLGVVSYALDSVGRAGQAGGVVVCGFEQLLQTGFSAGVSAARQMHDAYFSQGILDSDGRPDAGRAQHAVQRFAPLAPGNSGEEFKPTGRAVPTIVKMPVGWREMAQPDLLFYRMWSDQNAFKDVLQSGFALRERDDLNTDWGIGEKYTARWFDGFRDSEKKLIKAQEESGAHRAKAEALDSELTSAKDDAERERKNAADSEKKAADALLSVKTLTQEAENLQRIADKLPPLEAAAKALKQENTDLKTQNGELSRELTGLELNLRALQRYADDLDRYCDLVERDLSLYHDHQKTSAKRDRTDDPTIREDLPTPPFAQRPLPPVDSGPGRTRRPEPFRTVSHGVAAIIGMLVGAMAILGVQYFPQDKVADLPQSPTSAQVGSEQANSNEENDPCVAAGTVRDQIATYKADCTDSEVLNSSCSMLVKDIKRSMRKASTCASEEARCYAFPNIGSASNPLPDGALRWIEDAATCRIEGK